VNASTDILIQLAEVFDVTLDDLAFDSQAGASKLNIQDRELLQRCEACSLRMGPTVLSGIGASAALHGPCQSVERGALHFGSEARPGHRGASTGRPWRRASTHAR
jgi:hypothetical protein